MPAQRVRVHQRRRCYRPGRRADRNAHDDRAASVLAWLRDVDLGGLLLGSARLVSAESRAGGRCPAGHAVVFALPAVTRDAAVSERVEATRGIAETVQGVVIGGWLAAITETMWIKSAQIQRGA